MCFQEAKLIILKSTFIYERLGQKTVFRVSNQVIHKSVCAVTEKGYELEIRSLRRRKIVLSV